MRVLLFIEAIIGNIKTVERPRPAKGRGVAKTVPRVVGARRSGMGDRLVVEFRGLGCDGWPTMNMNHAFEG